MQSIRKIIEEYRGKIPPSEIRAFICSATKQSLEEVLLMDEAGDEIFFAVEKMCKRRLSGEFFSYIIKKKEFFGYEFFVNPSVLIPRPESEHIVEEALRLARPNSKILDLCTGSGCIAITIAKESGANVIGSDISDKACIVARKNVKIHKVENQVQILQSSWFANIPKQKFDIITCNPPYIAYGDDRISPQTKKQEPHLALYSGDSGLEAYEAISSKAPEYLANHASIILECGAGQDEAIIPIFQKRNFKIIKCIKDLAGIVRVLSFEL
ncbi:MAG: peptide chain release factor N(5)-glutamine methyltransferase [Rickettsiaceae bacterium]|nr:peptide chain release factor N(5)-glutamine methyltransferase [Rickettsiaceae bacterium]